MSNSYKIILSEDCEEEHPYYHYLNNFSADLLLKNNYLAPELLDQINNMQRPASFSIKNDIFALGMTVLSLCMMKEI